MNKILEVYTYDEFIRLLVKIVLFLTNKPKKFTAWSGLGYTSHLPHTISFLTPESIEDVLRDDYKQMQIGFVYANAPSFDEIMERLSESRNRFRILEW